MEPSYEEQMGPIRRRVRRVARAGRWNVKSLLGLRRDILVEIRWRLGDEVMALPIYEALKVRFPNARLTVWCTYPDLLIDNPHVDAVNDEAARPDRYILLRGTPRHVRRIDHYAERAGVPFPEAVPRLTYQDWHTDLVPEGGGEPVVAVCTGATWETKRWPIDRWQTLCASLGQKGFAVVQVGQDDERIGVGACLVDQTSVREAACVLRKAAVLVSCDSGLMHVALAAGTPVVALFGPTDPDILVPGNADLTAIRSDRECQGCWNALPDPGPPGTCPEGREGTCLDEVTPEAVLAVALRVLGKGG